MRGQSVPTGVIIPQFVNGWTPELDKAPAPDAAKAKAMLAEAGYPNGFQITLHCPNDRYVNDEGICQAAVGMLGQIGIKANLVSQSKTLHFPLIQKDQPETEFYLFGWGVPTFDSEYVFTFLHHSRTGKFGGFNATRLNDPELDRKIESPVEPRSTRPSATPPSPRSGRSCRTRPTTSPSTTRRWPTRRRTTSTSRSTRRTSPS